MAVCLALSLLALGNISFPAFAAEKIPAAPPPQLVSLIGTYGPGTDLLDVSERNGELLANGLGFERTVLVRDGAQFRAIRNGKLVSLSFIRRRGAIVRVVIAGSELLDRRDVGAEIEQRIRDDVRTDIDAIRARALGLTPPSELPPERAEDLVDLRKVVANVKLDIRYAGTNNFMGVALYERPAAFLQRPAAEALARVARELRKSGYGLKVLDAYRPWYVTHMFWAATPDTSHEFVADPAQGSRHNRGSAIDLTLYRLADGAEIAMPSRYDEMSVRAHSDYPGGTSRQRWARDLLRREMERQGFQVYAQEWWHYDYRDWPKYGVLNLSLPHLLERSARRPNE